MGGGRHVDLLHLGACGLDGLDDVLVAGAAADVPADRPADLLVGRIGVLFDERRPDEHHARRAEPALEAVVLLEGRLDGVERAVLLEALDGAQFVAVGLDGHIVHDFTGLPSSRTVQAPHEVVSQPMWVPVSRGWSG
jgi:hypothetical protein